MSKVPVPAGVVSIHASAREATDKDQSNRKSERVSIHASAREATIKSLSLVWICKFQSTPPRGRRHSVSESNGSHACFNPRLREGGDVVSGNLVLDEIVSIHASAREATALITKIHLKHHISFQHTVHKSPFNVNYLFQ